MQISVLASLGIVSGYGDGSFTPDAPALRQQFAKMIVGTLGLPVSPDEPCPFADVEDGGGSDDPLYPSRYVAVCADRGITLGKTATSFDPYGHLTKAPLITMVARAADLVEPSADYAAPFDDFPKEHYLWTRKSLTPGCLTVCPGQTVRTSTSGRNRPQRTLPAALPPAGHHATARNTGPGYLRLFLRRHALQTC